jgi:hypothetical protein
MTGVEGGCSAGWTPRFENARWRGWSGELASFAAVSGRSGLLKARGLPFPKTPPRLGDANGVANARVEITEDAGLAGVDSCTEVDGRWVNDDSAGRGASIGAWGIVLMVPEVDDAKSGITGNANGAGDLLFADGEVSSLGMSLPVGSVDAAADTALASISSEVSSARCSASQALRFSSALASAATEGTNIPFDEAVLKPRVNGKGVDTGNVEDSSPSSSHRCNRRWALARAAADGMSAGLAFPDADVKPGKPDTVATSPVLDVMSSEKSADETEAAVRNPAPERKGFGDDRNGCTSPSEFQESLSVRLVRARESTAISKARPKPPKVVPSTSPVSNSEACLLGPATCFCSQFIPGVSRVKPNASIRAEDEASTDPECWARGGHDGL